MLNFLYNLLNYFANFLVAAFFVLLGGIAILLPWSITMRTELVSLILENSIAISLIGFVVLLVGIAMLISLWMSTKKRYYYLRVSNKLVAVDEALIQTYVEAYWRQLFPVEEVPSRLVLKRNKIKIVANLPYKAPEERKLFLEKVQADLQDIFRRILGYSQDFSLAISFQPKKDVA
ncbi:MAG: hypothetical protein H0X51_03765 [Parachlamydiaceae bacterium]|nr:hypothetical protein [Parachlamydiaceae bacterium]